VADGIAGFSHCFVVGRVTGMAMLAMAMSLLRYDIARRTARQSGLMRFIALNLLAGFVWRAVRLFMANGVLTGDNMLTEE
jgi:uncharacterized membrane-anchored protein